MEPLRVLLAPVALKFGVLLHVRHLLFDLGWLKSAQSPIPTVVVGNLNVGGTGKTPLTEWLVNHMSSSRRVAVLSRGYGRSTKGFRWVDELDTANLSGDEALQMKRRFPHIPVAVCEKRLEGLAHIAQAKCADLVILDDAFQHRRLKGDFNLLLTPHDKPWFADHLLPWGSLRDVKKARKRAHAVVVTKAPSASPPPQSLREKLDVQVPVYAACLSYKAPRAEGHSTPLNQCRTAVALTALARPLSFEQHVNQLCTEVTPFRFRDHHAFTSSDLKKVQRKIDTFENGPIAVFTTEKDWTKLQPIASEAPASWRFFVIDVAFELSNPEELLQLLQHHTS